jgi:Uma2 family endonuclease
MNVAEITIAFVADLGENQPGHCREQRVSRRTGNCMLPVSGRAYNALMSIRRTSCLDAIEHLPEGATLVLQSFSWDDYERLVDELQERHFRVSYDRGRLEVVSPGRQHDEYARFIDDLVRVVADNLGLKLQKYGSATWKRKLLRRGAEADSCYYVANADRVIGKREFNLDTAPPPDIVVEIDITRESSRKFSIYAAFGVPEIWRYDGRTMQFFELSETSYREVSESHFFPGLVPEALAAALEHSKTAGQTEALAVFRREWNQSKS